MSHLGCLLSKGFEPLLEGFSNNNSNDNNSEINTKLDELCKDKEDECAEIITNMLIKKEESEEESEEGKEELEEEGEEESEEEESDEDKEDKEEELEDEDEDEDQEESDEDNNDNEEDEDEDKEGKEEFSNYISEKRNKVDMSQLLKYLLYVCLFYVLTHEDSKKMVMRELSLDSKLYNLLAGVMFVICILVLNKMVL